MAHSVRVEDDVISYCGSMSGETFSARRRRTGHTLKQNNISAIARKLRTDSAFTTIDVKDVEASKESHRFNNTFHHFRFITVMLGGLAMGFMLFLRNNISVAILSMVNQTALYMEEHPNKTMDDFLAEGYSPGGEFDWNNEIQQMLMTWYMFAYTLPQLPLTKLSLAFGSRKAMPVCLLICSVSTLLTPCASYWGWKWVLALRLAQGIGASAVLPLLLQVIEEWMHCDEMALGLACANLLQAVITTANPLVSGYLTAIHWSYAFYFPGAVVLVFTIVWYILVTDSPADHWLVSRKELDFISGITDDKSKVRQAIQKTPENSAEVIQRRNPILSDVFRIPSFYAFVLVWVLYCNAFTIFICTLPTYLRQFLKINVSLNGFYCFMIQTGCLVSVVWPHPVLRILEEKCKFSAIAARQITFAIVCFVAASTWIYVGYFHNNQLLVLFLNRCVQQSVEIVVTTTLMINYSKAGISSLVFSMVNTVGYLSMTLGSATVGYVLDHTGQSVAAWSWIYIVFGLSQILMFILFCLSIKAKPIEFKHLNMKKAEEVTKPAADTPIAPIEAKPMNNFDDFRRAAEKSEINQ